MRYREYQSKDRPIIEAMHKAQGYDYALPPLDDSRLWITRMVILDEKGVPCQAILGRLTSEAMYLDFPDAVTPATRMRRFLSLHQLAANEGRLAGMDSVHVWLPPEIKEKFGGQLERLGWQEYTWPTFMKKLGD
jgi:hypothetical protein